MTNIYDELQQEIFPPGKYISDDEQFFITIIRYSKDLGTVLYSIMDQGTEEYVHDGDMVIEQTPIAMNILKTYITPESDYEEKHFDDLDFLFSLTQYHGKLIDKLKKKNKKLKKRLKALENKDA